MTLSKITTHKEQMLARLLFQYKNKPNITKLFTAIAARYQGLEDAAWDLLVKRGIETGEGVQLDIIGKIIGQPRGDSADDADYRLRLRARMRANQSSGTPEDILSVFAALLGSYEALELTPYYPASLILRIDDTTIDEATATLYAQFLKDSRLGGVGAYLHTSPTDDANTFTCLQATQLTADFDPGATTMHVVSTSGFLDSGYLIFLPGDTNQWRVSYAYKTATTFEGCDSREGVEAGQSVDDFVYQQASPATEISDNVNLPQSRIEVVDSSSFPDAGYVAIGPQIDDAQWRIVSYSGKVTGELTGIVDTGVGGATSFSTGQIVALVHRGFGLDGEDFGGQFSTVREA